jgi:hypothetical protein
MGRLKVITFSAPHTGSFSDASVSTPHNTCIPTTHRYTLNVYHFLPLGLQTLSGSRPGGFLIFLELSNSTSPPAEPGDYLEEFILEMRFTGTFTFVIKVVASGPWNGPILLIIGHRYLSPFSLRQGCNSRLN